MRFYEAKKWPLGLPRLPGRNWGFLFGALSIIFSSTPAQDVAKNQSLSRQTGGRAEKLKLAAPPLVVDKHLFFQKASLGTITSIRPFLALADSQSAFWIAAERGAVSVADSGQLKLSVRFERVGGKVTTVDMDGDGNFEFLSRGGGQEEARLYDREGRQLWKYGLGTDPAVRDASCGDLDGDGQLECALAMRGEGGIRLLDKNGKERWRKPEQNVWRVEVLDLDGDGKEELLHTNAAGQLRVRNAEGGILQELPGNNFVTLFSLCRWPGADSGWFILNNNNYTGIQLFDFKGNNVTSIPATAKGYEAIGTPVRFKAEDKSYFALLVCNCTPHRDSHLFIYDPEGEIIYEEKFLPSQAALLAVRDEATGEEALLVGEGEGRVWKYRLVLAASKN
ncbi:MAG: FG-GAP repeat domain-containing protein [Limisphaerales bacterium]